MVKLHGALAGSSFRLKVFEHLLDEAGIFGLDPAPVPSRFTLNGVSLQKTLF